MTMIAGVILLAISPWLSSARTRASIPLAQMLGSLIFQVLEHPRLIARGKALIDLLNGPIGHARRWRVVSQRHQQMFDLRILGMGFEIFLIGAARFLAAIDALADLAEIVPGIPILGRQLDNPFPEESA